jgi:predicted RNA-binding Zn-ribbon protein involved in translation (DUF1610 family)
MPSILQCPRCEQAELTDYERKRVHGRIETVEFLCPKCGSIIPIRELTRRAKLEPESKLMLETLRPRRRRKRTPRT